MRAQTVSNHTCEVPALKARDEGCSKESASVLWVCQRDMWVDGDVRDFIYVSINVKLLCDCSFSPITYVYFGLPQMRQFKSE